MGTYTHISRPGPQPLSRIESLTETLYILRTCVELSLWVVWLVRGERVECRCSNDYSAVSHVHGALSSGGRSARRAGVCRTRPRQRMAGARIRLKAPRHAHRGAVGSAYDLRVATAVQSPPTSIYLAARPSGTGATAVSRPEEGGWSSFLGFKSGAPPVRRRRPSPSGRAAASR